MRKHRAVKRGMRFIESGPGHTPFGIVSVYGRKAKTTKGTTISVSRLSVLRYYKQI